MKFDNIQKQVKQQRCAGFSYAQENPAAGFRDMVTVYCDGRLLFERFARARPRAACARCGRPKGRTRQGASGGITAHALIPGRSRRQRR